MDQRQKVLSLLGALALGTGSAATLPSDAFAQQFDTAMCRVPNQDLRNMLGVTEEECACMLALEANTVSALEAFLAKYPPRRGEANACTALALQALGQFVPDRPGSNDNDPRGNVPTQSSGG